MCMLVLTWMKVMNFWKCLQLILFEPQCESHHRPWRNFLPPETFHTILMRMAPPQHLSPVLPELGSAWTDPYMCRGRRVNDTSSSGVAVLKHRYSVQFCTPNYKLETDISVHRQARVDWRGYRVWRFFLSAYLFYALSAYWWYCFVWLKWVTNRIDWTVLVELSVTFRK